MASIFQQDNSYYLSVSYKSNRIKRSLATSNLQQAKKIAKQLEAKLLIEMITGRSETHETNVSLPTLINHFLAHDHG